MDSPHSFVTPTTCFKIACVAFSVLAISIVWNNQSAAAKATNDRPRSRYKASARPQPTRRKAVDSLFADSGLDQTDDPYLMATCGRDMRDPVTAITSLVAICTAITQQLREASGVTGPQSTSAAILAEVTVTTTTLCRLQQRLTAKNSPFILQGALTTCFDVATAGLKESLLLLSTELSREANENAIRTMLQQVREQRPALEFMLESSCAESLPPTPPAEIEVETSHQHTLTSEPTPTGLTPAINPKGWNEPPPEYSPPADGMLFVDSKGDKKDTRGAPKLQLHGGLSKIEEDALYSAVTNNDLDLVVTLLEKGADPNAAIGELQRTPLHQAAHLNYHQSLSYLLRSGAVMSIEDVQGDTAMHLAAWSGNVESIATLLAHGADVDWLSGRDSYSPLWCAVSGQHIDAARLLLKHGARLSQRSVTGNGMMPLHQAAVTGQGAMCELLLERGARVDPLDDDRNTPLAYAAASGSAAAVQVLLQGGASIDVAQAQGLQPVHWAAHKGHSSALGMLLSHGAQVSAVAEGSATPLHLAAARGHAQVVRTLLDKGARRGGEASWDGLQGTPAEMARHRGHARVAKMIDGFSGS